MVEVVAGEENPAYTIMRKAIAKSKYHLQQIDSYNATVYIKGSGRLKKAPFWIRRQLKKEGIARDLVNRSQNLRKDKGFEVQDKIDIKIDSEEQIIKETLEIFTDVIKQETQANSLIFDSISESEIIDLDGVELKLEIV